MVAYEKWVSIVFEVAPDDAPAPDVLQWAATQWSGRKEDIKAATVSEARQWASKKL